MCWAWGETALLIWVKAEFRITEGSVLLAEHHAPMQLKYTTLRFVLCSNRTNLKQVINAIDSLQVSDHNVSHLRRCSWRAALFVSNLPPLFGVTEHYRQHSWSYEYCKRNNTLGATNNVNACNKHFSTKHSTVNSAYSPHCVSRENQELLIFSTGTMQRGTVG